MIIDNLVSLATVRVFTFAIAESEIYRVVSSGVELALIAAKALTFSRISPVMLGELMVKSVNKGALEICKLGIRTLFRAIEVALAYDGTVKISTGALTFKVFNAGVIKVKALNFGATKILTLVVVVSLMINVTKLVMVLLKKVAILLLIKDKD